MSPSRYSRSAMALHWAIALALAFQLALGWRLEGIRKGPMLFWAYQLHKSVGISILMLSFARLAIRFLHPRPVTALDSVWAQRLANGVHAALYVVMIGGPLTGWALVSTAKIRVPTLIFGVLPWPHLPLAQAWHDIAENAHGLLAPLGIGLFLLHVTGALRHQFFHDSSFLGRMVPVGNAGRMRKPVVSVGLAAGLLGAIAMAYLGGDNIFPPFKSAVSVDDTEASLGLNVTGGTQALDAEQKNDRNGGAASNIADTRPQEVAVWKVAPGGNLGFTAQWAGTPINGSFSRWTSVIRFSPDVLDRSSIRVTVDLASASTGDSQRDDMLAGDTFFQTAVHPKAVFTSSRIRHLGGAKYQALGALNLRGVNRPAALVFALKIVDSVAIVEGSTNINRIDFGVGQGEWAATDQIAADIGVTFKFTAKSN